MQLNKIIFSLKEPKVLLVINGLILLIFLSCNFKDKNNTYDYEILNYIIHQNTEKPFVLKENRDNEYVIATIKQLKEIDNKNNASKKDSIRSNYGIPKNEVFNTLFNSKSYDDLISQRDNSKWNLKRVDNYKIDKDNIKSTYLFVSKPVYDKNEEIALVYISKKTISYILVLQRKDNSWEEYKIISSIFKQPKVEKMNSK